MFSRNELYLHILEFGLLNIRAAAFFENTRLCEIEADHLHNIPSLIDEGSEFRHEYYFDKERALYLERLKTLKGPDKPKSDMHRFVLGRYMDLWTELRKTYKGKMESVVSTEQEHDSVDESFNEPFEMNIKDVFFFKNGPTVLAGPISGTDAFIGPCKCEVVIGKKKYATVQIDGEMMAHSASRDFRSISTFDRSFTVDKRVISTGNCVLRPIKREH